jgi:hypothetical protein
MASKTLTFRPDHATVQALKMLSKLRPGVDTSSLLREAIQAYARELTLAKYIAACDRAGYCNVAVIEEFERASDA